MQELEILVLEDSEEAHEKLSILLRNKEETEMIQTERFVVQMLNHDTEAAHKCLFNVLFHRPELRELVAQRYSKKSNLIWLKVLFLVSIEHSNLLIQKGIFDDLNDYKWNEDLLKCVYNLTRVRPEQKVFVKLIEMIKSGSNVEHCVNSLLYMNIEEFDDENLVRAIISFVFEELDNEQVSRIESSLMFLDRLAHSHEAYRKILRKQFLPTKKPDNIKYLINQLTSSNTNIRKITSDFLFTLCKENSARFIFHVGYGNAAGLLLERNLFQSSSQVEGFSSDEEAARLHVEPVEVVEMTEEEKIKENERLLDLFERLEKTGVVQIQRKQE